MALTETNEASEKKSSNVHKGPDKKEKFLTKVIIRRLPPNMDQATFLNQISPVPTYDYLYMVKGDASLGENSFSRAYINFTNPNDIYDFKEKFDNYVFLDSSGHEYPAVVEFAAFQKIPKRRSKVRVDPKVGTIESDPYYLEFVEMINKPPEPDEKPEYTYQITESKNEVNEITPLLEYVKNKRVEKMRIREERREERKRKEFERKKFREDERKKRYEESPVKNNKTPYTKVVSPKEKSVENKEAEKKPEESEKIKSEEKSPEKEEEKYEKSSSTSYYKNREKKYEDRKKDTKNKYPPKKEYVDKREYKRREDFKERDYRPKYDEYKKEDPKVYQKKVKKYSEKREERKIEAQKAEQKKLEQQQQQEGSPKADETTKSPSGEVKPKESTKKDDEKKELENAQEPTNKSPDKEVKVKDNESHSQRRIRNKDRPTIAIYRPGMLSKRKCTDGESEPKENKKE